MDEQDTRTVADDKFEPWNSTTLNSSWILSTSGPPPKLKDLRSRAEALLNQLESGGCDRIDPSTAAHWRTRATFTADPAARVVDDAIVKLAGLGVDQANAFGRAQGPNTISVALARGGTWSGTADAVPAWVARFVADPKRADNIRKLDRGGAESHLAVQVHLDGAGFAVWRGIGDEHREGIVPNSSPVLPTTITDVWLSTSFKDRDVLHFNRSTGWTRKTARPIT